VEKSHEKEKSPNALICARAVIANFWDAMFFKDFLFSLKRCSKKGKKILNRFLTSALNSLRTQLKCSKFSGSTLWLYKQICTREQLTKLLLNWLQKTDLFITKNMVFFTPVCNRCVTAKG